MKSTIKEVDTLSNFELQKRSIVFQHKLRFNLAKDPFNWYEGRNRSVKLGLESEKKRTFEPACLKIS